MAEDSEARPAPPCTLVIFGVMGDLARRLLVAPALYNLAAEKLLPEKFALVGIARQPGDTDTFRRDVREGLNEFAPGALVNETRRWLEERLHYLRGDFEAAETYEALAKWLAKRAASDGVRNAVFYLATPPDLFGPIVTRLGQAGLTREDGSYLAARHHREALRDRSEIGAGAQPRSPHRAQGEPDLPDRSLSRQRDRSEHHGLALRQRDLRAAVEPRSHRSGADHGGRDRGR
jgi:hypothetical protein